MIQNCCNFLCNYLIILLFYSLLLVLLRKHVNPIVLIYTIRQKPPETMTRNISFGVPPAVAPNDIQLDYPWIDLLQNVFFILSCAMSISLLVIIWSYLQNMRSVDECVLLHLYKDFVAILILFRIALVIKGIVTTFAITYSQNVATMNQLAAKIMSSTIQKILRASASFKE